MEGWVSRLLSLLVIRSFLHIRKLHNLQKSWYLSLTIAVVMTTHDDTKAYFQLQC